MDFSKHVLFIKMRSLSDRMECAKPQYYFQTQRYSLQMEHQCRLKYNNQPLMIHLSQKQQQGNQRITKRGSLTEVSFDQSHITSHLTPKDTIMDSLLFQTGKNLHAIQPQRNNCYDQKAQKNLTEHQAISQKEPNQQNFQSRPARSIFQNFQKHLITTLKTQMDFKQNFRNDPIVHVAHRMWNIFTHTNYFSKKILHFLFGVKSEIVPGLEPNIHPNFNSISSIYPKQEIQLAQEYLREQVVRQGRKVAGSNLLKKRRMRKGQEFLLYFLKFIQELQNGGISRRLPKKLKNRD